MDDLNLQSVFLLTSIAYIALSFEQIFFLRFAVLESESSPIFMMFFKCSSEALLTEVNGRWQNVCCKRVCVYTHRASGQNSGCSSLLPCRRNTVMSKEFTSEYGGAPRVISSHSNTPNDHWRKSVEISFLHHCFPFASNTCLFANESEIISQVSIGNGLKIWLTTSDLVVNLCVCRLSRAIHLTGSLTPLLLWTL